MQWIVERIKPLNAGRFYTKSKGAKSNCTLLSEKCTKVLAGLEEPVLVPVRKANFDITTRIDEEGAIVYHEVSRPEQVCLIPQQEFLEIVDLLNEEIKTRIDLIDIPNRETIKFIPSTRMSIIDDLKSYPGSAASHGQDKTLTGLIYYYYQDVDAGNLANFFRDKYGNVFFVDAQNEKVTSIPPNKVLNYVLKPEISYKVIPPIGGFFIKKEPKEIKQESYETKSSLPKQAAEMQPEEPTDILPWIKALSEMKDPFSPESEQEYLRLLSFKTGGTRGPKLY